MCSRSARRGAHSGSCGSAPAQALGERPRVSEVVRKGAEVRPLGAFAVPARTAVPIALGAIVAIATVVHALLGLGLPSPWIVPDELIYSELAKSLGAGG